MGTKLDQTSSTHVQIKMSLFFSNKQVCANLIINPITRHNTIYLHPFFVLMALHAN